MSGRAEALCRELLDLALAQRAVLAQGGLDDATVLMEKRRLVLERIQIIATERPATADINAVADVDRQIADLVLSEMGQLLEGLKTIRNIRIYLETTHGPKLDGGNSLLA